MKSFLRIILAVSLLSKKDRSFAEKLPKNCKDVITVWNIARSYNRISYDFPTFATMAKEKNKPVPVRFDLKLLEVLKEEEKIDTPQQALNFLAKFWENNRPATDDLAGDPKEVKATAPIPKIKEREAIT